MIFAVWAVFFQPNQIVDYDTQAEPITHHYTSPKIDNTYAQDLANDHTIIITQYKSEESERFLWDCLNTYAPTKEIAAGVIGYFWRESSFRSDAIAGWTINDAYSGGDSSKDFTSSIDAGLTDLSTKEEFITKAHDTFGGYGLGQWYNPAYLDHFYDFASQWGTSIGDAEMQCAFVIASMQANDKLWALIENDNNPYRVGWHIAKQYDGTTTGDLYIAKMAEYFYNKYA